MVSSIHMPVMVVSSSVIVHETGAVCVKVVESTLLIAFPPGPSCK